MMHVYGNSTLVRVRDQPNEKAELRSCPSVLYRYLPSEFAQQFLDEGRMRVMPLSHYRNTNDIVRADANEGDKLHRIPNGPMDGRELGPGLYIGGPVWTEDNTNTFRVLPSYCLCFCMVASRELADRFGKKGPPNTPGECITINDAAFFLSAVDAAFRLEAPNYGLRVIASFGAPIHYKRGSITSWSKGRLSCDPRLVKAYDPYAVEVEYRMIWSVETSSHTSTPDVLEPMYLHLRVPDHNFRIVRYEALSDRVRVQTATVD